MSFRKWFSLLLALCLLLAVLPAAARDYGDDDGIESVESMRVVRCKEWVSLREKSDTSSRRLAKVPLGAVVNSCIRDGSGMVFCKYEGEYGFILEEYLEPFWKQAAGQMYRGKCPLPMTLNLFVDEADTELDWEKYGVRVLANHYGDSDGTEALILGVFAGDAVTPSWTYMLVLPDSGELQGLTAFMGGTAADPQVMVYHCELGLTMLDLVTGEEKWTLSPADCSLGAGNAKAVSDDGIVYITGYYGPHPVANSAEGTVLWKAESSDGRLVWPYVVAIAEDRIRVKYRSQEDNAFLAEYDLNGNLTGVQAIAE